MLENRYTVLRFRLEDIDGRTGISQLQRKLKKTDSIVFVPTRRVTGNFYYSFCLRISAFCSISNDVICM